MGEIIPMEVIEKKIFFIRGQKVMIDRDLAELYGVENKYLHRQVKRNLDRFPAGFMFMLSTSEKNEVVTICHHLQDLKYSYQLPLVFTEQGVAMLSSILRSKRAIQVNILIMKTFVRLRELITGHQELVRKISELEQRYDAQFKVVFDALRQIITPPEQPKKGSASSLKILNKKGGERYV